MSFDLALSPHGDLIFAANRDLAGISGIDLIEQRIRLRLRLQRGQWVFDETRTLGSQLYQFSGRPRQEVVASIAAYVNEALRPMSDEINVNDVNILEPDEEDEINRSIQLLVLYQLTSDVEPGTENISNQREVTIDIPLSGGGGI